MEESQKSLPVQYTNDDSIVSKRSASRFGYVSDEFLRPFVQKSPRRSALINRGYYIRIKFVRDTLIHFLSLKTSKPKQIISLGAGFDTSFWFLKSNNHMQEGDRFYEIDFDQVVERKMNVIKENEILHSQLGKPVQSIHDESKDVKDLKLLLQTCQEELEELKKSKSNSKIKKKKEEIKSITKQLDSIEDCIYTEDYILLKGDLRQLDLIESSLRCKGIDFTKPTLFMTECVLNYIPSSESDLIIKWTCIFDDAIYFSYDQIHPHDAFGNMMCKSLKNRSSPLLGIQNCPTVREQELRFKRLGYKESLSVNVLSCYENCLDEEEKKRIDALEDFDEHEEWIIKCQHYSFTISSKNSNYIFESLKKMYKVADPTSSVEDSCFDRLEDSSYKFVNINEKISHLQRWGHSTLKISNNRLFIFGGYGGDTKQVRNNSSVLFNVKTNQLSLVSNIGDVPSPRMYFSSTIYKETNHCTYAILFGGRGGPKSPYNDFYSIQIESSPVFKKIDIQGDVPLPRWRHTASLLCDGEANYLVIFGGRTLSDERNNFKALNDLYIVNTETWVSTKIECLGDHPTPRYSHSATVIENGTKLLIFGGFNGIDLFNDTFIFDIKTKSWEIISCHGYIPKGMFSHSDCRITIDQKEFIVIIGGCSLEESNRFHIYDIEEKSWKIFEPSTKINQKDTLLINHTSIVIDNDIFIIGGGALCFSFGSFFNNVSILSLFGSHDKIHVEKEKKVDVKSFIKPEIHDGLKKIPLKIVENVTEELLNEIFLQQFPVIIKGLNFGDCVDKWSSKDYFHSIPDKLISTRKCKFKTLDFINKNFEFTTMNFKDFIDKVFDENEEYKYYFRSVGENARKERSDFWKSFPEIKDDFIIPSTLNPLIQDRVFLSALRIGSKDSQLWTHYDICDNFLFQIVGKKEVVLWHPSDYDNLYVEDSSSLVLDIKHPNLDRFPKFVNGTQYIGIIEPGDTLFIPALWLHNISSLDPTISINVFWKKLEDSFYNTKDLYGNKMLIPAERAFEKVEELISIIQSIPEPYKSFYLKQITNKLENTDVQSFK